jgi:hypothetical protein
LGFLTLGLFLVSILEKIKIYSKIKIFLVKKIEIEI